MIRPSYKAPDRPACIRSLGLRAYGGEESQHFWSDEAMRLMNAAFVAAMKRAGHEATGRFG